MAHRLPHASRPWSAEEVAQLRRLAGREAPARQIGKLLGRTERAVRSKAYKERISLAGGRAARHEAPTWAAGTIARAREYVVGKVVAGVTAYARRNTGQAIFIAAAAGVVLGFALGGGCKRGTVDDEPFDSGTAEKAIANWEGEGGSVTAED